MQDLQNCRALVNTILGPRGLNPVEAQGRPRFAKWHLGFLFVVRSPITLRLLHEYMQDIEEVYIYIYICYIRNHLGSSYGLAILLWVPEFGGVRVLPKIV